MAHSIITNTARRILGNSIITNQSELVRNYASLECKATLAKQPPPPKKCTDMHKPLGDKRFAPVTHVIFNLDGVLVNSERLIMQAHMKYLSRFKKHYPLDLRMKVQGRRELDAAALIVREHNLPLTPEVYAHGVRQHVRDLMPKAKITKGIRDLICHLSLNKIPIALNTSSTEFTFPWKTRDKDLKDIMHRFCHITYGTEVKNGKPDPESYVRSMRKFEPKPKKAISVLAIEDSEAGVLSAKAAGLQTVMYPDIQAPAEFRKHADLVITDITKLDLDEFSLPVIKAGTYY
ncbi:pseudouridine-5'-phosphatase-like [Cimex lectularius]|uniref:Uncharacterized protein n=1 Tax=Cimex lectularius TaxID=79782 RepID=A0A8I6RSE8_CIMLE|nr:pseudouridine-5'-phosphatase-like [Cimex lectularius]